MHDYKKALLQLLKDHNVPYELVNGGKHRHVTFVGTNGRRYKRAIDSTISDQRSIKNAISQLRNMLREAGFAPPPARRVA